MLIAPTTSPLVQVWTPPSESKATALRTVWFDWFLRQPRSSRLREKLVDLHGQPGDASGLDSLALGHAE